MHNRIARSRFAIFLKVFNSLRSTGKCYPLSKNHLAFQAFPELERPASGKKIIEAQHCGRRVQRYAMRTFLVKSYAVEKSLSKFQVTRD